MKKWISLFLSFFILFSLCGSMPAEGKTQSGAAANGQYDLEVHFIDVGQGDATLILCGDAAMLIDAGENDKGTLVQNYIRKQGVESLDYLVVTHPDSDHCGGADVIITKYDIGTVLMPNYARDTAAYRDMIKALDYKGYSVAEPAVGDSYRLGSAEFMVIAPNKEDYGEEANNYSVGILLEHGRNKFIFTGDAEEEAEEDILCNGIDISADVLKVGHHGSRTSSGEAFIDAVDPEYAVVSCGENNEYGHPHAATLNTLRSRGVKLFRTDEQGSLVASSDGKEVIWNAAPSDTWKAGEPTQSREAGSPSGEAGSFWDTSNPEAWKDQKPIAAAIAGAQPEGQSGSGQQEEGPVPIEAQEQAVPQDNKALAYVLNVKTKKFHYPTCDSLPTANRSDSTWSREEIVARGYVPCKRCNP